MSYHQDSFIMFKIISHRGNIKGSSHGNENSPSLIDEAISFDLDVEVDLWTLDKLYLGHDTCEYTVTLDWLTNRKERLWIHAKNIKAAEFLVTTEFNWFWHENDSMTLTSKGIPWAYPGIYVKNGITVCFSVVNVPYYIKGVCTDEPLLFRDFLHKKGEIFGYTK